MLKVDLGIGGERGRRVQRILDGDVIREVAGGRRRAIAGHAHAPILERSDRGAPLVVEDRVRDQVGVDAVDADDRREAEREGDGIAEPAVEGLRGALQVGRRSAGGHADDVQLRRIGGLQGSRPGGSQCAA